MEKLELKVKKLEPRKNKDSTYDQLLTLCFDCAATVC